MKYEIYEQEPKQKRIGIGRICMDRDGIAITMTDDGKTITGKMERSRVEWMHADGIMISGFESVGCDRQKKEKFRLQTWFCRYIPNNIHDPRGR